MKSIQLFLVPASLFLSLCGMDDEEDIYSQAQSAATFVYSAPSLTQKNVYPIRIYPQLSRLNERKPLCGTRKQYEHFLAYKKEKRDVRLQYKNLLKGATVDEKSILKEAYEAERKLLKEKFATALYGRFCMYTAVNRGRKCENHWECWHQFEREQEAIARLRMNNPLRPNDPLYNYDHYCIPQDKKQFCDHMMEQMALFFSDKKSELQEGPYVTTMWGPLLKNRKREKVAIKHELVVFKSTDFDLKDIAQYWAHEETRHILQDAISCDSDDAIIIPLTTFLYGDNHSDYAEKQAAREKSMYDIEAVLVQPVSKKAADSKVYKLS